jgi:hypothetical protein
MENVEIFEVVKPEGETVTYVKIDRGNGEFTSMLKSTYEAQQAEQSTPMVSDK